MTAQRAPSDQQGLPVHLTPFIGRHDEINDITRLLEEPACRLLTLLAPGGAGKTRLAIEAARRVFERFPDGVIWVDLQAWQAGNLLEVAIADTLSLSLTGGEDPLQQLVAYLGDKTALLLLDNFEPLLEAAGLLTRILRHAPAVRILVTSRVSLQLQEEWLYPLSGLPYPAAELDGMPWEEAERYDAVRLFVERVQRVRPTFVPRDEQADLLGICRLVEGMPLALELAASWARSLDCATIASEIRNNLAFLTSTVRNVPPRHRSIRAVFDYSCSLLTPDEEETFRQLATFRGGFRREAAEQVTGATLHYLTALVDKSLLRWEANGLYRMHELLRQYAAEQLEESPHDAERARERHALYYLDFLYQRTSAMHGGRQREGTAEIGAEFDNVRAAWAWAVRQGWVDALGRATEPLAMFCHIRSRYLDGAGMFEEALRAFRREEHARHPSEALVLSELGWISIRLGRFDRAARAFRACKALYEQLALLPLPGLGTDPRLGLSTLASIEGNNVEAERLALQALRVATAQPHYHNLQNANYQLASIAHDRGAYEEAQRYARDAYDVCQRTGDRWFMAYCLSELGRAAWALGNHASARRHFEESYAIREEFSDLEGMGLALTNMGNLLLHQQRPGEARALLERSAALYRKSNDRGGLAAALLGLGKTAMAASDYETARGQFGQALAIAAEIRYTPLLLSILAVTGQFLLRTGRAEEGAALLSLVQHHPATDQETRALVVAQVRESRATLSPVLFERGEAPMEVEEAVATARRTLADALPPQDDVPSAPLVTTASLVEPLSEREREVLQLIALGLTNRQIAERLTVVTGTVKAHNNSIYGKLGVTNRMQAVARARELGLL